MANETNLKPVQSKKEASEKGLAYWSAVDYLKNHKTTHSII